VTGAERSAPAPVTPAEPTPASAAPEGAPSQGASTGRILLTASLILTVAALASRLLGWLRLVVIGSQFGASREIGRAHV
jgi:hypothetical protein